MISRDKRQRTILLASQILLALIGASSVWAAFALGGTEWMLTTLGALFGMAVALLVVAFRMSESSAPTGGRTRGEANGKEEVTKAVAEEAPAGEGVAQARQAAKGLLAATGEDEASAQSSVQASTHASVAAPSPVSQLDYERTMETLLGSADPWAELKLFVGDIRTRQAHTRAQGGTDDASASDASEAEAAINGTLAPSELELFVARQLEEAGLFSKDVELPEVRVAKSERSGRIDLRIKEQKCAYLARVRVLSIEAALNAMRFSDTYFDDLCGATQVQAYKLIQNLTSSICAQSLGLDEPLEAEVGEDPDGEWAVRRKIAQAIDELQLPYRLEWSMRANVRDGNVSFKVALTPESAFPASMYVEGLGVVQSSREMRRKAASAYAQRIALLMAATAFRASWRIKHVWFAGTIDTATRHWCYLSVDFDRWRFSKLDLAHVDDLPRAMRPFVPTMRIENDILRPVKQTFDPEEPRFCPPERFAAVSLTSRRLKPPLAQALGTPSVNGLAIEEADKRRMVASDILLNLVPSHEEKSTERNVRMVMELAANDPDPTVRSAAERTVRALIDGTVDSSEPLDVGDQFVSGDALTQAVRDAKRLLAHKMVGGASNAAPRPDARDGEGRAKKANVPSQDAIAAARILTKVLAPIDENGLYADSPTIEHRYFGNYVDRALYNRMLARERSVFLVPDAYFEAHFILSVAYLAQHDYDAALSEAWRLFELAPLDRNANMHLVRCLEECEKMDEARKALTDYLKLAHDPDSLGVAYYRMAFFQWQANNLLAAQACYQLAMTFSPSAAGIISVELAALALQNPQALTRELSQEQVVEVLEDAGVPLAPTQEVSQTFMECTRASLDAEVFPVAKNFAAVLGSFTSDDVVRAIIDSLEDAPDR